MIDRKNSTVELYNYLTANSMIVWYAKNKFKDMSKNSKIRQWMETNSVCLILSDAYSTIAKWAYFAISSGLDSQAIMDTFMKDLRASETIYDVMHTFDTSFNESPEVYCPIISKMLIRTGGVFACCISDFEDLFEFLKEQYIRCKEERVIGKTDKYTMTKLLDTPDLPENEKVFDDLIRDYKLANEDKSPHINFLCCSYFGIHFQKCSLDYLRLVSKE